MITLDEALKAYYDYTGRLSDNARQLSFAGVAIIWVFRIGGREAGGIAWDPFLIWPLGIFVAALALDLTHYGYYSAFWGLYHRGRENEIRKLRQTGAEIPDTFRVSPLINRIGLIFFWGKVICVAIGFAILLVLVASCL